MKISNCSLIVCQSREHPELGLKKMVRIHIGEYYASRNPIVIYTLLGSCVAVCLFDPVRRIGGMNHILMPGKADMKYFDASARYGINAMELLINRIMNLGGSRRRIVAKVFGGARTLPTISEDVSMGKKNIEFVVEFLKNETIRIVGKDMGGTQSRRVYFHADTGEVFLKRGQPIYQTDIPYSERKLRSKLRYKIEKSSSEITLF